MLWPLYLLTAFLLLCPMMILAEAVMTPRGGYVHVTVELLPIKVKVPFRVTLLAPPFLLFERLLPSGQGKHLGGGKRKPKVLVAAALALKRPALEVIWTAGTGDAADTAMACGLLKSLTEDALTLLLPEAERSVYALPSFDQTGLRLEIRGITSIRIAEIIRRLLLTGREKSIWRTPWKTLCRQPSAN